MLILPAAKLRRRKTQTKQTHHPLTLLQVKLNLQSPPLRIDLQDRYQQWLNMIIAAKIAERLFQSSAR
jgi:hypothetical protein